VAYEGVPLMCDSSSAICLVQNLVMKYIDTERQLADIFTKPHDGSRFPTLRKELGVCHLCGLV
jgi:hypothetical protein